MTSTKNIALALSTIAVGFAGLTSTATALPGVGIGGAPPKPSSHKHAKGVSKAKYIKTADRLCATMNTEFTPAWEGIKAAMSTDGSAAAGEAIMVSAKATQATFLKLRALPRPVAGGIELIGYFNADSERIVASYNVGVDEHNEEPFALGSDAAKAEIAKVAADEAVANYGFTVCGLS
jgi:hypothetical protein